jgi:type I restriction enzyme M protein
MPKLQEIPRELKEFNRIFEQLSYRHQYSSIFEDFLSITVAEFARGKMSPVYDDYVRRYTKEERSLFNQLFKEMIRVYDEQFRLHVWYDLFGDYYQVLASNSKQSAFGQFFTPAPVVDLMVKMMYADNLTGKGLRISDPTCGSGRMLIAFHANHPGNYQFAEDLDGICCKMTCINMMLHGCVGEVVQHNSLMPDDFMQGWKINSDLNYTGIPSILPMNRESSVIMGHWERKNAINASTFLPVEKNISIAVEKAKKLLIEEEKSIITNNSKEAKKALQGNQLTIF